MAFLLKTTVASHLRSQFQKTGDDLSQSGRRFHIELGAREKALLAEDPALKRFKSHKKDVRMIKGIGYVLTLIVLTGFCYEFYVRAYMKEEAQKEEGRMEAEAAIERA